MPRWLLNVKAVNMTYTYRGLMCVILVRVRPVIIAIWREQ